MPLHGNVREGDWTRLLVPVVVLVASVGACSAMRPADAGTPIAACRADAAQPWIGRAASADIVEQARRASGSESVGLVMPGEPRQPAERIDRLELFLDERSIIAGARCG
jgi:hypothetical protein